MLNVKYGDKVVFVGNVAMELYHSDFLPYYGKEGMITEVSDAVVVDGVLFDSFRFTVRFHDGEELPFKGSELRKVE